jgi:hypothetical protein
VAVDQAVARRGSRIGRVPSREPTHGTLGGRIGLAARGWILVAGALHRVDGDRVRLGRLPRTFRLSIGGFIHADLHAEQTLLQLAVRLELGGGHRARDAPVHHHVHGIGDLDRHAEVLLDQEHGNLAVRGEVLQHVGHLAHDDRRQPLRRLVHHEQDRIEEQRPRDGEHLLLAAGELGAAIALPFREPRKRLVHARHGPRPRVTSRREAQVLVHGERRPHASALRHIPHAPVGDGVRRKSQDLLAGEPHTTRRGDEARDRIAQRRLAHAVSAHHRRDPPIEAEGHLLQRVRPAVVDVELLDGEDRAGGPRPSRTREPAHQCAPPPPM